MPRRLILISLISVLLAACSWPMAGDGPDRRGWAAADKVVTPGNVSTVASSWTSAAIGHGTEPIGDANTVIEVSQGKVRALDRASGAERWSVNDDSALTPALRGDALITTYSGCAVRSRSLTTGTAGPAISIGAIPVPTGGLSVCGIDSSVLVTGSTTLFSYRSFASGPAIHCGTAWALEVGLVALDENLATKWSYKVPSNGCGTPPPEAINAPPFGSAASDGVAVFLPRDVTVTALGLTGAGTGSPAWVKTLAQKIVGSPLVLANGDVAVTDVTGTVTALDPITGNVHWTSAPEATATGATIGGAATDASILLAGSDGVLRAYTAAGCGSSTCTPTWTAPITHTPSARPSIAGDVIYVPSSDGALVAFDARGCGSATCTKLATVQANHPITAPPAIISGRIIVTTATDIETFALPS